MLVIRRLNRWRAPGIGFCLYGPFVAQVHLVEVGRCDALAVKIGYDLGQRVRVDGQYGFVGVIVDERQVV